MTDMTGKLIYEVTFKVKSTRSNEFEEHCKDVIKLLENHNGFNSLVYSKRLDDCCEGDYCMYRGEIVFDNESSLQGYKNDIVPKIRSTSTKFGQDAKVQERRTYSIFCCKS
jgi:hypothetical protein